MLSRTIDHRRLRVASAFALFAALGAGCSDEGAPHVDEELGAVSAESATWELTGQNAWRWMRWDVRSDEVSPLAELESSTADVLWFEVDGRVYGTETTSDYSHTTLIELTAEGGPKRELTVPGFLQGLARIR